MNQKEKKTAYDAFILKEKELAETPEAREALEKTKKAVSSALDDLENAFSLEVA